jgi:glucosyl-3-phosphoglycerate phosphatase
MFLLRHGQSYFNQLFNATRVDPGIEDPELTPLGLEQAAYACDIGSAPEVLASRFPHHDFAHLPARWWHDGIETTEQTLARALAFQALMAARGDSATTLLVGHWAFILALTGTALANGEILEYDSTSCAAR